MVCRVASTQKTLMSTVRPARAMMLLQSQQRLFSNYDIIERSAQKLGKALDSEIKYENENYTQLEDIDTFLNDSGFTFRETDDGLSMTLTKEVGENTVEISFDAR